MQALLKARGEEGIREIAITWADLAPERQLDIYKYEPEHRPILDILILISPEKTLYSLEHLEIELALELLRSNQRILARCKPDHAPAIVRVLARLDNDNEYDLMEPFRGLNDESREAVLCLLDPASRSEVEKTLMEGEVSGKRKRGGSEADEGPEDSRKRIRNDDPTVGETLLDDEAPGKRKRGESEADEGPEGPEDRRKRGRGEDAES